MEVYLFSFSFLQAFSSLSTRKRNIFICLICAYFPRNEIFIGMFNCKQLASVAHFFSSYIFCGYGLILTHTGHLKPLFFIKFICKLGHILDYYNTLSYVAVLLLLAFRSNIRQFKFRICFKMNVLLYSIYYSKMCYDQYWFCKRGTSFLLLLNRKM